MKVSETAIADLLIIEPDIYNDQRGYFFETYQRERYQEQGIVVAFVQDNCSLSKQGVIRGLHYQAPPVAQGKLVTVLRGSAFDVAVDIRHGSPTYGEHVAVELNESNKKQFWIPEGFAHGFMALEDETLLSYKCTQGYSSQHDRGILYNDRQLAIPWPELLDTIVSEKDQAHPRFQELAEDFHYQAAL